jgi:hypothetical protein
MLDDLREQADQDADLEDEEESASTYFRKRYTTDRPFLGMTAGQRLVIAIMLLLLTCILGTFCLAVTERVYTFAFF